MRSYWHDNHLQLLILVPKLLVDASERILDSTDAVVASSRVTRLIFGGQPGLEAKSRHQIALPIVELRGTSS